MKETIFFLENDPEFRERAVAVLSQEYEVLTAEGVREGWNVLGMNKERIKLLLLDIMMTTDEMFDIVAAEGGLLSGVLFYRKIQDVLYKNMKTPPAIFLTALKPDLDSKAKQHLSGMRYGIIMKKGLTASLEELNPKIKEKISELQSKDKG